MTSFSFVFNRSLVEGGVTAGDKDAPIIAPIRADLNVSVPAGATDLEFDITVPIARILVIGIASSQNITIKTNSASSPGDTLTVPAGQGLFYASDRDPAANKFLSANVTKIYVTNPGTVAAQLVLLCGLSAT